MTVESNKLLMFAEMVLAVVAVAVDDIVLDSVGFHTLQNLGEVHCFVCDKDDNLRIVLYITYINIKSIHILPACTVMTLCIWWTLWNILTICWLLGYWSVSCSWCIYLLYHRSVFSGHSSIAHIFIITDSPVL